MNKLYGPRSAILPLILLIVFQISGCQSISSLVATVTPIIVPNSTKSIEPTISDSLIPSQSISPTLVITETLEPPLPTAINSGPFKMIIPVNEVLSGNLEGMVETSDGSLWLITNHDIGKIEGTTLKAYLKGYEGKIAGIDANSRVWMVNEALSQISAWDGKTWTSYGADSGWTPPTDDYYLYVRGGQSDLLDRVWFATSKDVRVFKGGQWTVYPLLEMGMEPSKYEDLEPSVMVNVSQSGTVWVTECDWGGPGPFGGQGVRWFEDGVWHGTSSLVASGCATLIVEDNLGNIWVGMDSNLWRYDPAADQWQEFSPPESPVPDMRFGFIDSLTIDSSDTLWPTLVLCGGASCYGKSVLYHIIDNDWTQIGETREYDSGFWGPLFDGNNNAWINWSGGIYQIDRDTHRLVSPLAARFAAFDSIGKMWLVAAYEGRDMLWVLEE